MESLPDGMNAFIMNIDQPNPKEFARYTPLKAARVQLEQACNDEDLADACLLAGSFYVEELVQTDFDTSPKGLKLFQNITQLLGSACKFGSGEGCDIYFPLAYAMDHTLEESVRTGEISASKVQNFQKTALHIIKESCLAGNAKVCLTYSSVSLFQENIREAANGMKSACLGGLSEGCFWGALMHGSKNEDSCVHLLEKTASLNKVNGSPTPILMNEILEEKALRLPSNQRAIDDGVFIDICESFFDTAQPAKHASKDAFELANRACHFSDGYLASNACELSTLIQR